LILLKSLAFIASRSFCDARAVSDRIDLPPIVLSELQATPEQQLPTRREEFAGCGYAVVL